MHIILKSAAIAGPEFCAELLSREGFIDLDSGNGKVVMKINTNIDPHAPGHGEPCLSIRAPWGMQADDTPNGTVGLIAVRDGVETVFIINKNSHTILKKFTR